MSTLSEKITANQTAIEQKVNQTTPDLPAAWNKVIAAMVAVSQQSIEKVVTRAQLENIVKTATLRENGGKLNDIGEERGINYRYATAAIINVQVVAVDGTEISPAYSLSGDSNGLDYTIGASHIATGGLISFPVTCTEEGPTGNLAIGDTLTLSSPLPGAAQVATVVSTDTVGASAEGQDVYRERILDELRNPGEAGNLSFYRKRGREAEGVEQIYPYRGELVGTVFQNPGDVSVYVEATTEIDPDGIPTQAVLDAAEEAIRYDETGQIEKAPTTLRELHILPITRDQIYFTITGLTIYDSTQLGDCQSDIEEALTAALLQKEPFIPGLDFSAEKNDTLTNPNLAGVVDDVVKTYAGKYSALSFGFSPGAVFPDYTLAPGQKVKFGGANYV